MNENEDPQALWPAEVIDALRHDASVLVLTGAGMASESGIPTFRDAQTGHWAKFRPEELATPHAFATDPERVWRWYADRRNQIGKAAPHGGHYALVALEQRLTHFAIVTQNVDGLHQRAGSERVLELHGSIMGTICSTTRRPVDDSWLARSTTVPPRSPHHPLGLCRPDVVWFGESLPEAALTEAFALAEQADLCLCVGTSSVVQPAAQLPLVASDRGAVVVEINPEETPLSGQVHHRICATAGEALPLLAAVFS